MAVNSLSYLDFKGQILSIQQIFLDVAHPIGSTYPQYPQQASPMELFNTETMKSTWEILPYDGAFFRSCNVPKLLYTTNGEDFYIDVEFIEKISISDLLGTYRQAYVQNNTNPKAEKLYEYNSSTQVYTLTNDTSVNNTKTYYCLWAVEDTGDRTYNSKGEEIQIWKGSWLEGYADPYINKTNKLNIQSQQLLSHKHNDSGHVHGYSDRYMVYGGGDDGGDGNHQNDGAYRYPNTNTGYAVLGDAVPYSRILVKTGVENRPNNYTERIWLRIN